MTFVIDVSDMGDADFSYGLFTRQSRPAPAGVRGRAWAARSCRAALIFAKGKYYVEIAADPGGRDMSVDAARRVRNAT